MRMECTIGEHLLTEIGCRECSVHDVYSRFAPLVHYRLELQAPPSGKSTLPLLFPKPAPQNGNLDIPDGGA